MLEQGTEFRDGVEPLTASLARLAASDGDSPAFTFIDYGEHRDGVSTTISWSELDTRARAVAARLGSVTARGERVALLCPQNLDYVIGFFASMYAGVVAVPLFAPEVSTHGERLVGALADCDPEVWLTSTSAMDSIRGLLDDHPVPRPKQILAVDTVPDAEGEGYEPTPLGGDQPAYLQYTSGSTRSPAGAVITTDAVAVNVAQVKVGLGVDSASTCVGWLPFFHDMGLVQLVCLPVGAGCHSVFTTPFAFTRRPTRWLKMIGGYPNVVTAAPNFAFEYAIAKLSDADRASLDLSGVRSAINGSEPVRATTIAEFQRVMGPLGFAPEAHRPSYGLAEATVFVSTTALDSPPLVVSVDRDRLGAGEAVPVDASDDRALTLVTAGVAVGQHVRIVDTESMLALPDGRVGEIWVHGPNVARGYWQQPERSAETFDGTLAEPDGDVPTSGWLRTGDLGVVHEGQIFITGRSKDLIIIDGRNHYPQDIEATVQDAHPAIRRDRVAVFAVERDSREVPVVMAEHSQQVRAEDLDADEIDRAVRAAVAKHHDLRLADFALVRPGVVKRTSSGKIARSANRRSYLEARDAR